MIKDLFFTYKFIKHNKKIFIPQKKNKNKILVDFFEYKPSMLVFSYLSNILAEKYDAEIILSKCDYGNKGFKSILKSIFQKIFFLSNWNIFKSFGAKKIIYTNFYTLDNSITKKIYNKIIKKIMFN